MQICTVKLMSRCIKITGVNAQITSISCTQDQIPLVQLLSFNPEKQGPEIILISVNVSSRALKFVP